LRNEVTSSRHFSSPSHDIRSLARHFRVNCFDCRWIHDSRSRRSHPVNVNQNILCNPSAVEGGSSCPTSEITTHNSPRGNFSTSPLSSLSQPLGFSKRRYYSLFSTFPHRHHPLYSPSSSSLVPVPSIHGQTIKPLMKPPIPLQCPCTNL
jgi:hypothetical protein